MHGHNNWNSNAGDPVSRLIFELSKLPGIGEKTATRLAYFILRQEEGRVKALADALVAAKHEVSLCKVCFTFADTNPCRICGNPERDHSVVCVVERPSDALSVEQSGAYRGTYHVLHGALSPLDGIGPEELKIRELLERIRGEGSADGKSQIRELILATNPSVEGEATALYLARLIKPLGVKITRLASGLPVGGLLEYTDRQTIGRAVENRMEMT